ncbi:glutathione-dependent disulfide-bond oxidoreductase [Streptococcus catagoni]|uniref:glutathione-dependent disulfide-bond oxidoreductase n=1 Tax=Streptococcus catagoni TaxID=2654874 RepID=UPI00140A5240|nr:glutathione-dependent disulfide-bond oxidoreductase [Streptococcus catagoni]
MSTYELPKIWKNTAKKDDLNQASSGARFEQVLPKGQAPYQLYTLETPNGIKPLIMFEELKELAQQNLDYDAYKIDIGQGQQFGSDFVAINPNSKIPALVDQSEDETLRIFESSNILLYLAEKYKLLLGQNNQEKTEILNWLFWQTGAAPFLGGGFGHFFHYAPEKLEYPINRYSMESKRQLDLLDKELAKKPYIAGHDYSIADIAIWSWYGRLAENKLYENAAEFLNLSQYQHLMEWSKKISNRPAVKRALDVTLKTI